MLLEVRIGGGDKGAQTVFPGSVHETGEPIDWEEDGEPSEVDGEELVERAKRLAALCLFARHDGARVVMDRGNETGRCLVSNSRQVLLELSIFSTAA
jgi:hypothetical protein